VKWLVLIHVLSAIIGVGPAFFNHVLLKSGQSLSEMRHSMTLFKKLELFPKIGGTLAVLSGIALAWNGDYGKFTQLWMIGSLVVYIVIQLLIIVLIAPAASKVTKWLGDPANRDAASLPAEQQAYFRKAQNVLWLVSILGVVLFIFMIMKPVFDG